MRVVLDTNIFVSMAMGGQVGQINDAWKAGRFTLIVSPSIVSEYQEVMARPKLHLDMDTIAVLMERLYRRAEFVQPTENIQVVPADPTDNKFLEAALAGKAIYVVSGDSHLLQLKTFRGIAIITAREFIERLS